MSCRLAVLSEVHSEAATRAQQRCSEFGISFTDDDNKRPAVLVSLLNGVEPRMTIRRSGFGHFGAKRHRLTLITHDTEHKALRQLTTRSRCLLNRNGPLVL